VATISKWSNVIFLPKPVYSCVFWGFVGGFTKKLCKWFVTFLVVDLILSVLSHTSAIYLLTN
jgi:hypothetical protein